MIHTVPNGSPLPENIVTAPLEPRMNSVTKAMSSEL